MTPHVLSMSAARHFLIFFWGGGNAAFMAGLKKKSGVSGFCNVKAYKFPIQVFIHDQNSLKYKIDVSINE